MKNQRFSVKRRIRSFRYAYRGALFFFRTEHNARIHLTVALLTVLTGLWFRLSKGEWIGVLLCIGMVFISEILNTAIEYLCDFVHPDRHPQIREIKDVAASAVLVCSLLAVIIGLMIFYPHFRTYLSQR